VFIFYIYGAGKSRSLLHMHKKPEATFRAVTPAQCRAARALLEWKQNELAEQSGVGIVTVHQFEAGATQPRRATLDVIRRAFERAGVVFIDQNGGGAGVRFKKAT
jgi:DNA-binding transcriptional regulator YiaG